MGVDIEHYERIEDPEKYMTTVISDITRIKNAVTTPTKPTSRYSIPIKPWIAKALLNMMRRKD